MKKFLLLMLLFTFVSCVKCYASDVIYSVKDGTTLMCTGQRVSGSIYEYLNVVDYYTFRDGKIYSKNLINLYGNINKDAKKVMRLKISNDTISFKDRLLGAWVGNYKWVKINRHTGQYTFNAKKDFGTWYRVANVSGFCKIVE